MHKTGQCSRGHLIILNPNRPHCCPLSQGQGPHGGTHPLACEMEHIFSVFPNHHMQHRFPEVLWDTFACAVLQLYRIHPSSHLVILHSDPFGITNRVQRPTGCRLKSYSLRALAGTHPVLRVWSAGCTRLFGLPARLIAAHLHPLYTSRACSFAHQRFLWCIRGSNKTWSEFVCGRGSCLLTKRGSKQHRP